MLKHRSLSQYSERADARRPNEDFDDFVATSSEGLLRTAYVVTWDLGVAEDLVQECLLKVARRWRRVRMMDYPFAYTRRILVNLALDGSRRQARERSELEGSGESAPFDQPDENAERSLHLVDLNDELSTALATLSPRQRAVLVLRYLEDLPESEVAEVLGCSVGTVKSTASRSLDRLKALSSHAEVDVTARSDRESDDRPIDLPTSQVRSKEKGEAQNGRSI